MAYDIADDRRLRRVHTCVTSFGSPLQYSVFICDLSPIELIDLRTELRDIIHHAADRVALIELGDPLGAGRYCFEFMGAHPKLPAPGGPTIA